MGMLKESKKVLLVSVFAIVASFSTASADSALMPVWDEMLANGGVFGNLQGGGIFSSGGVAQRINPKCTYRDEYNPFTGQTTRNEICDPNIVSYYVQPTVAKRTQTTYYNYPTPKTNKTTKNNSRSYYNNNNYSLGYDALSYYSGSNIWYPQNNHGYSNSSMFSRYYWNDPYDYYYDSPNLCFNGGRNCGGRYDGVDGLVYYPYDDVEDFYDEYDNFYINIGF